MIDREELALPWRYAGLELVRYGGVMLQLKSDHGYVLTFTPQSNEFTITLLSSTPTSHTAGLCGSINTDPFIQNRKISQPCLSLSYLLSHCLLPPTSVLPLCLSSRCLWGGEV